MAQQDYYQTLGVGREADADEIRKAYRKLARKHHPDLNPGDKAAEDRFKKVQEAYDILSDPKKKQMYDQYGFYSENGAAGAGAGAQRGGPNMGFGGFDFSDAFTRGGGGRAVPATDESEFSGHFQPVVRSATAGRSVGRAGKRFGPRIWPEHRFLAGDQGHASASEHQSPGNLCDVRRNRRGEIRRKHGLPGMQRQRQRDASRGRDEIQPDLSAMQRNGTPEESMPDVPWRRPDHGRRRRWKCGSRRGRSRDRACAWREREMPERTERLRAISTSRCAWNRIRSSAATATISRSRLPVRIDEAGLGTKIEVPTIDGRALLKIPQGTKNGQKFRLREKGVLNTRSNKRGDQIVEVELAAAEVHDERTKELLREYGKLHPEDPRAEIWTKV